MVEQSEEADLALALARQIEAARGEGDPGAREISRQAIVDCLGVTIAGSSLPAARIVASRFASRGDARIIGTTRSSTADGAALANGVAAHVLDFDDGHPVAMAHPSAVLVPALLGMAEERRLPGADVVSAHAIGVRVFAAIGAAVNPAHYLLGWHATSSLGALAAAAAVSSLLRLTPEQTAHALGIAATQSGGTRRNFGSMTKPFHAGWAAHAGVIAAQLASGGFTAGDAVLEGRGGWLDLMVGDGARRASHVLDEFRDNAVSAALSMSLKRFAACGTTHTALEAALELRAEAGFDLDAVQLIECEVHPSTFEILRADEPLSGLEGKFSLEHCLAVALIDGDAGLAQFTDERVADPRVRTLARRVRLRARDDAESLHGLDPDKWTTRVRVDLANGRPMVRTVARRRGSFSFEPMSEADRRMKFVGCLQSVGHTEKEGSAVFAMLERMDESADIRDVTAAIPVTLAGAQ